MCSEKVPGADVPSVVLPVVVVGGGPAGLMAAQMLAQAGHGVHLFDAMPSVGRKLLLAGKGGLNLTHSEDFDFFLNRYGSRRSVLEPLLQAFDPSALRAWVHGLGLDTFVGSSGRVFPTDMKAAPLLRAWLHHLRHPEQGVPVRFHMRHRWVDWEVAAQQRTLHTLVFDAPHGQVRVQAPAVVLALGGASWSRLGSDGAWVPLLVAKGVEVAALQPANCGFDVAGGWSPWFATRYAGQPFKSVALTVIGADGQSIRRKGEFVATATGVEGSLVYAFASVLRDAIVGSGSASLLLDLLPDLSLQRVLAEVSHPRGSRSLSSHLKSRLHLDGIKSAVLHEVSAKEVFENPAALAQAIKAVPLCLQATRPLDEAISSAGGVAFEALNSALMLNSCPGIFCAGEMLDWEAPTGGYLLNACLASGRQAGVGAGDYLAQQFRLHPPVS